MPLHLLIVYNYLLMKTRERHEKKKEKLTVRRFLDFFEIGQEQIVEPLKNSFTTYKVCLIHHTD